MVELSAGELEAAFAPEVGMVGASLRHRGEELLGQRGGLEKYAASGSTFGIPLLHPWANRLGGWRYGQVDLDRERSPIRVEENGLPIHGLLAASPHWRVADERAGGFTAAFSFDRPELLLAFPYPHELEIDVSLTDAALSVRTTVRPTGVMAVPVSFGYHPYLALPGVPRRSTERRRNRTFQAGGCPAPTALWNASPDGVRVPFEVGLERLDVGAYRAFSPAAVAQDAEARAGGDEFVGSD